MELDQFDRARLAGEEPAELAGEIGLSGTGRPLEDDLALVFQEADQLAEEGLVQVEPLGQVGQGSAPRPPGLRARAQGHPLSKPRRRCGLRAPSSPEGPTS